jgi:excisionase family DNA binding protein
MADELMTVREVARACGRSEETVRRWIWSGKLPAAKLGNQLFVKREDMDAMRVPRVGEVRVTYEASLGKPPRFGERGPADGTELFRNYDYSPIAENLREHRGQIVSSAAEEAEHIAADEAFQDDVMARFGQIDVLKLLGQVRDE